MSFHTIAPSLLLYSSLTAPYISYFYEYRSTTIFTSQVIALPNSSKVKG